MYCSFYRNSLGLFEAAFTIMKSERKTRWQAILLCILLTNQFFVCIAKQIEVHHREKLIGRKFRRSLHQDFELSEGKDQCPVHSHHRQKSKNKIYFLLNNPLTYHDSK